MRIAQQIDYFFKSTGQTVFIEAEAKESRMQILLQNTTEVFRNI